MLPFPTTKAEVWFAPWPLTARLACSHFGAVALGFVLALLMPN